ncbi:MAG TPA: glycoside hydrolase family 2 TIM barrel-domain containing protein, partial [Fimbriimonas sp.]
KTEKGHELTVDGVPFFVKGAVGWQRLDLLKEFGANALRCSPSMLDECAKNGLMALVGLPLGNPRHGFDYSDAGRVEKQRKLALDTVRQYKDHPALLVWNIGNEPEIHTTAEQRLPVWRYVESLAQEIKAIDPNHPVICVVGGEYREMLHEIPEQCPSLDAVGLNSYADMLTLPEDVRKQGYSGAYLVTEFGPRGHWQVEKTPWGMPIEDTSTEKSAFYRRSYEAAVANQPNCLGSFTFLWAQKQEKTHTWYGMMLPDGSPIETVGAMREVWGVERGDWPSVGPLGIHRPDGERLRWAEGSARSTVEFEIDAVGGDADWDLRKDVADNPNVGGDREPDTPVLATYRGRRVEVRLPADPGSYRLFAYVRNGQGRVATANLPIRVQP